MKKNNLINSLFATLLIASPLVGADQKYPAADFQPEVVFQDNDYIAKNSSSVKTSTKLAETVSTKNNADSKYPAANFEPQVIYSDANYKPSMSSPASSKNSAGNLVTENSENTAHEGSDIATSVKAETKSNYLVGLIALGLVGAFLLKDQFKCGVKKSGNSVAPAQPVKSSLTGVARYLNKISGTGVSRYLEKQVKLSPSAATGVAKYMARQVLAAKSTASGAVTGVEKYMRDRG